MAEGSAMKKGTIGSESGEKTLTTVVSSASMVPTAVTISSVAAAVSAHFLERRYGNAPLLARVLQRCS